MIETTANRVRVHTNDAVDRRIWRETLYRITYFTQHPEQIDQRLSELDREWDVERMLETGSSTLTLTGMLLAIGVNRKWLLLSLAVQGFFMQHALQGWCPPLPILRRFGFRTADEINRERYTLRALRCDAGQMREDEDVST